MLLRKRTTTCTPMTTLRAPARLIALLGVCCASAAHAQTPTFAAQQTFATGTKPHAIVAVDLNADGRLDLVVANQDSDTVSLLLNTTAAGAATTTFATQTTVATNLYPVAVIATDINGDGKPDLVVADAQSYTISVLINTTPAGAAAPTFAAKQTFATSTYPFDVAAADLDGDGKIDLIAANAGTTGVTIFHNTTTVGATTATFAAGQFVSTGSQPSALAVVDVNRDGKPDLVVANFASGTASVLLNTTAANSATATFADQVALVTGAGPSQVGVADFNGDGKADIVIVDSFQTTVSVYLNTTATGATVATFSAEKTFAAGLGPTGLAVGDINGDGRADVIVTNQGAATASVLLNTTAAGATTPSFAAPQTVTTGTNPVAVIVADINSNGVPDLVVANNQTNTVSVLVNTTNFAGVNLNQHGITGSWFNAATGGQGIEIEVYPDLNGAGHGLLFGGWFTYDTVAGGGQRWYALSGNVSTSSVTQLGIYAGLGGNFATGPVIPPTQVGIATLHLTDCGNGILTYAFFDGRSGTIALSRLTANVTCGTTGDNGNAPSTYLLSGSWSDPTTGGQGLIFDVNPVQSNFFAAWYTYAPNGQQTAGAASERWYTIQAGFAPGTTALTDVPIYATTGGIFNNSSAPTAAPVGTASITFQSCSAATLTYAFTAGASSGLTGTVHLTRTGPTPAGCTL